MTKKIIKKEDTKPDPVEQELQKIKKYYSDSFASTNWMEKDMLADHNRILKDGDRKKEFKEKFDDSAMNLSMFYAIENGVWVSNLSYGKYQPMFSKMRKQIVEEYGCKSPSELMLADSIVANYWLIMRNQMNLARMVENEDGGYTFNQSKINIINILNKVVDSSSRRLYSTISLLKELKQPSLKVNVKTNNAFIGHNQQFNDNKNNDSK